MLQISVYRVGKSNELKVFIATTFLQVYRHFQGLLPHEKV